MRALRRRVSSGVASEAQRSQRLPSPLQPPERPGSSVEGGRHPGPIEPAMGPAAGPNAGDSTCMMDGARRRAGRGMDFEDFRVRLVCRISNLAHILATPSILRTASNSFYNLTIIPAPALNLLPPPAIGKQRPSPSLPVQASAWSRSVCRHFISCSYGQNGASAT
jgi:hypothetical protein